MSIPERMLLADVPRVHFYEGGPESPEDVTFPSCLAACMRYLGEDYPWIVKESNGRTHRDNYAYIYILAHSGMAFGLRWREGWHMDNVDHMMIADPADVVRRAFSAVGYTYELVEKTGTISDRERFVESIHKSLSRGVPVLAFGIIGPPECCLVTGYDSGGDVLIGWNFFQGLPPFNEGVNFESTGQFREADWFEETHSLVLIGEKTALPELHQLNCDTLRWALQVMRTPMVYDHLNGHAAYAAWARQLADDGDFAGKSEATLRERHEAHDNVVGMLAECRWFGAQWLRHAIGEEPAMASELKAAAECFEREHDLMWEVWGAAGGHQSPDAWRELANPDVRRKIIALIGEAREEDVKAADHLERALAAGSPSGPQ